LRGTDADSWPLTSCSPHTRFIHEAQIRAYLLDFLLRELKDIRTPLLQECRCFQNGEPTGYADYFLKVHGSWLPVEAKLNVLAESGLSTQIAKYIHVESFVPTKGRQRGREFHVEDSAICLVADQSGLYVTVDGEFVDCSLGEPTWKRTELEHATVPAIRQHLRYSFLAHQQPYRSAEGM
jgi:hypothetical protein